MLHVAITSILVGSFITLILELLAPLHTRLSGQEYFYFGGVVWLAFRQTLKNIKEMREGISGLRISFQKIIQWPLRYTSVQGVGKD